MKKEIKIRPIGDRILVRPIETKKDQVTESGIILPGKTDQSIHERGLVIAVGPGRTNTEGERIKMEVKIGDIVLYKSGYDKEEVSLNGERLILTYETNLLAVEI